MLPRAARPEGPERLPALRPAAPGRRALIARLAALLLVALAAAAIASGCGGDDESSAQAPPTTPDLTVPQTDEEPAPAPDPVEPVEPAPAAPVEPAEPVPDYENEELAPPTTPVPEAEQLPPDGPGNDLPPPPDSAAERFEQFCDENPGAGGPCG